MIKAVLRPQNYKFAIFHKKYCVNGVKSVNVEKLVEKMRKNSFQVASNHHQLADFEG